MRQTIGLGGAETIDRIEISWPGGGSTQIFDFPAARRLLRIVEGRDDLETVELEGFQLGAGSF